MSPRKRQNLLLEIKDRLDSVYGHRMKGLILYGSEARGNSRRDSDIDLLVLLDGKINYGRDLLRNISALYPISRRLGRRISAKPASDKEYSEVQCPLYQRIHQEGIRI
ncbi:MAG TPA: nucleotidyltransferase domain-containing protein [Lentisphaeria bacterium]|nr:MAG: hypothetical protein A2X48_21740 [Lentisphaerae bacterium GWF2_49_21]HBC85803.1 nucleotidyltransferase domain-containing protein [Lentisphaeria bacterium]